jgi:pimeloyl-ACP methyl ester carboxylesterase
MPEASFPPEDMPKGRIVHVPGRGEFFVRDSCGDGTPVLLLHGIIVSSDLNWVDVYGPLQQAGFRVLAMDVRGHGRGLRDYERFRLEDCAADAAALLRQLDAQPAIVVGYSMGGAIAQLVAQEHADSVRGLVFCATTHDWSGFRMRMWWYQLVLLRLAIGIAPYTVWRGLARKLGAKPGAQAKWAAAELTRGSAREIARAGFALGRYGTSAPAGTPPLPAAVIVTTMDKHVRPEKQCALAHEVHDEHPLEIEDDHFLSRSTPKEFSDPLVKAVQAVAQ